ncbi:MAG: CbiX/SirB N-terminal domain-containing protein [Planctomycetes bacterium]|nr:CbiX/SirB N-terminal domain-containing protein [Planctomycetota bacterium]
MSNGSHKTTAVLLIAHGSRRQEANDDLLRLADAVRKRDHYQTVEVSYLEISDPTGIINASLFVPTLNTGSGSGFDNDSFYVNNFFTNKVFNSQLPVDRSDGQTRIDFFKLAIGLDNMVTFVTGIPLNFSYGNDYVSIGLTLIDVLRARFHARFILRELVTLSVERTA